MRAIGFHGTSVEAAQRILSTGFEISRNEYDWLGDGAYFFQDAPARALEWALQRFGANAAVIGAEIDLDDCIDLLDIPWEQVILTAFDGFIGELTRAGKPIPRQTAGAHRLDRYVIDYLATRMVCGRNAGSLCSRGVSRRKATVSRLCTAQQVTRADRGSGPQRSDSHLASGRGGTTCWIQLRPMRGWSTTSKR
jgi:hypothetical protein